MPSMPPPTTFRPPAPSSGDPEPVSRVLRFGAIVGAGAIAAALATVPAAMRVTATTPPEHAMNVWLALIACAVVPSIVGLAILRGARQGLSAFAGPDASAAAVGFFVWAVLTFAATAILGAVLRATTHHHGLAGVTFAIASLATGLGVALAVRRALAIARGATDLTRGAMLAFAILLVAATITVTMLRLARAASSAPGPLLPPSTGVLFVDLFAFAIAIGFLSRAEFARQKLLALLGLPIAVGMIVCGLSFLHGSPILEASIAEHAPAFAPILPLLLGR